MTPSPSPDSLQSHLLTRADLDRLELAAPQIDEWIASGTLARLGQLPTEDPNAGEVFAVTDAGLREQLKPRLAAIEKSAAELQPEAIQAFLHGAAGAADPATDAATSDQDLVRQLEAAVAALIPDLATVAELAAGPAQPRTPAKADTEWFDVGELEAAMGEIAPLEDEPVADDAASAEPLPEDTRAIDLADDLYALAEMVHGHGERLDELANLPTAIEGLAQRVLVLQETMVEGGLQPDLTPPAEEPAAAESTATTVPFDGRRVAGMTIGIALIGWSALLWFGTGSATLTLTSLMAASFIVGFAARTPGN